MRSFLFVGFWCAFVGLSTFVTTPAESGSRSLTIKEQTKYYTIGGENALEFALSMGRKGPYSFQHRRRAWATAGRNLTYQLVRQKMKSSCRIRDAKVKLTITYTMPKLARSKAVSGRERAKWEKMYKLLNKHERTHGLYYKQMARKVHSSLKKLKPASNCSALDQRAKALVKKLSAEDKARNDRFDQKDRKNYLLMSRIYSGS